MLRKNINTVAMLIGDALLCHFRKGMYVPRWDKQLHTLISYILLMLSMDILLVDNKLQKNQLFLGETIR